MWLLWNQMKTMSAEKCAVTWIRWGNTEVSQKIEFVVMLVNWSRKCYVFWYSCFNMFKLIWLLRICSATLGLSFCCVVVFVVFLHCGFNCSIAASSSAKRFWVKFGQCTKWICSGPKDVNEPWTALYFVGKWTHFGCSWRSGRMQFGCIEPQFGAERQTSETVLAVLLVQSQSCRIESTGVFEWALLQELRLLARSARWRACQRTSLSGLLTLFRWQYEGPDLTPEHTI